MLPHVVPQGRTFRVHLPSPFVNTFFKRFLRLKKSSPSLLMTGTLSSQPRDKIPPPRRRSRSYEVQLCDSMFFKISCGAAQKTPSGVIYRWWCDARRNPYFTLPRLMEWVVVCAHTYLIKRLSVQILNTSSSRYGTYLFWK